MTVKTRSYQIGIDADKNKNFVLKTPPIPDGSIALYRGNADDLGDKVWEVDAQGNFKAKTLNLGTPVAMAGKTGHTFAVPTGVKRVTLFLNEVSGTSASGSLQVFLGTALSVENVGYTGASGIIQDSGLSFTAQSTTSFIVARTGSTSLVVGSVCLERASPTTHTWIARGNLSRADLAIPGFFSGAKTLAGELTSLVLSFGGADVFDAGTANISWEY